MHEVHVRGLSINLVTFGQKFYRMTRINKCHSDFIEEANYCTLHCLAFCTPEVLCRIFCIAVVCHIMFLAYSLLQNVLYV